MFRLLLVTAAISLAYVSSLEMMGLPIQYGDLMPAPVKSFMTGFTERDQATMRQFYQNYHNYNSREEADAALRAMSPELAAKIQQLQSYFLGKVASLGPEARAFYEQMDRITSKTRAQFYSGLRPNPAEVKKAELEVMKLYRAMSATGKAEFTKNFPVLAMYYSNDKLYQQLQSTI
ncbi:nematode fatty acid retinoid binding protein [Ancylostoma caninum]|uniref:Nematode fatty acid retinoid binding protein n=1 Tax=Ancylostoma caninum TaxID=29170 RepID=A0A368F9F7_ANCCA|nr:nematode fatty acid retinoid binding protein [Ancylostoma caninum]